VFEALVRTGGSAPSCSACHGVDLERLLSTFAVSSSGRTRAAAAVARAKAATTAARDNRAMDREINEHRKEDH
jgi:hypothetical protein